MNCVLNNSLDEIHRAETSAICCNFCNFISQLYSYISFLWCSFLDTAEQPPQSTDNHTVSPSCSMSTTATIIPSKFITGPSPVIAKNYGMVTTENTRLQRLTISSGLILDICKFIYI